MTANVPPAPIEALSVSVRQVAPRLRGHTKLQDDGSTQAKERGPFPDPTKEPMGPS